MTCVLRFIMIAASWRLTCHTSSSRIVQFRGPIVPIIDHLLIFTGSTTRNKSRLHTDKGIWTENVKCEKSSADPMISHSAVETNVCELKSVRRKRFTAYQKRAQSYGRGQALRGSGKWIGKSIATILCTVRHV